MLNTLNTGVMPPGLNETFICLIPKVKFPQKFTEFRPISLCNVSYEIISKVLANRLKKILADVIKYLEVIMRKLGFSERWISLVLMRISTVSYFVLINGEAKGNIVPSRGLRQGDPISPYLFLLCAEGLSAMLRKEEELGNIRGISVCRGVPRISHLFFADDSIVFCRANMDEGRRILKVLEDYEGELGQKLNKEKTSFFFSKNTLREVQEQIK